MQLFNRLMALKDSDFPITVNPKLKNGLTLFDIQKVLIKNDFEYFERRFNVITAEICMLIGFENKKDEEYWSEAMLVDSSD